MIYLDHAAATPVLPQALAAMQPYFTEFFFNPSAPYLPAKRVREAYETAKDEIAHAIGAKGTDLVMTAGATESINLAFTVVDQLTPEYSQSVEQASSQLSAQVSQQQSTQPKCLCLTTEHAAVLEAARLHNYDLIEVDKTGYIQINDLRKKLTDDVAMVSISLANNELGTIQPLAEISEILRKVRQDRLQRGITLPLYFHSDASQALSLIDINVARLGVDLMTINAAKCGGPKGVGALYVAHSVKLQPVVVGGGQERGLRSGTENVPGVIGFAAAVKHAKQHLSSNRKKYQEMSDLIRKELSQSGDLKTIPMPIFLGNPKHQLANFVPVCFPGIDAERLIYKLEQCEIFVSTGAACAANKGAKSHVLTAIGLSDEEIASSLRISLGSTNTEEQIAIVAQKIVEIVQNEYCRILAREGVANLPEHFQTDTGQNHGPSGLDFESATAPANSNPRSQHGRSAHA